MPTNYPTSMLELFSRNPVYWPTCVVQNMSSSDLSDVSSSLSSVADDLETEPRPTKNIHHYFTHIPVAKVSPPPRKKRALSPPHEYTLADNPDIAVG